MTIGALENEKVELEAEITAQVISDEQIQQVEDFTKEMAGGLEAASQDFKRRRQLIRDLGLTVRLVVEDGEKVIYVKCLIAKDFRLSIVKPTIGGSARRISPRWRRWTRTR